MLLPAQKLTGKSLLDLNLSGISGPAEGVTLSCLKSWELWMWAPCSCEVEHRMEIPCSCEVEYQCTVHFWGWVSVHCAFEVEYQCTVHVTLKAPCCPTIPAFRRISSRPEQPSSLHLLHFLPVSYSILFHSSNEYIVFCILYADNENIGFQNFHFAQLCKSTANHGQDKKFT